MLSDERPGRLQTHSFGFDDGLLALASCLVPDYARQITDPIPIAGHYETGEVTAVLHFFDREGTTILCYANDVATPKGGTPLDGLIAGVVRVLNSTGSQEGLIQGDGDELCRHDVASGLTAILSVYLHRVEYGGNIRAWVANPEARSPIMRLVEHHLGAYLTAHPAQAREVVQRCLARREYMDRTVLSQHDRGRSGQSVGLR